jgi:hypothetical protein
MKTTGPPKRKKGPRRQARPEINQQFDDQIEQIVNSRSRRRSQARKSDTVRGELAAETGRRAHHRTAGEAGILPGVMTADRLSTAPETAYRALDFRQAGRKRSFGRNPANQREAREVAV